MSITTSTKQIISGRLPVVMALGLAIGASLLIATSQASLAQIAFPKTSNPAHDKQMQPLICEGYANGSVKMALENKKRKCNYSGFGWSVKKKVHLDWCMSLPPRVARLKTVQFYLGREHRLESCKR